MKKLLTLIFFVSLAASAATFQERVEAVCSNTEDAEIYMKRCGQDPHHFNKEKKRTIDDVNITLLSCMESKVSELAAERLAASNLANLVESETTWLKAVFDCETYKPTFNNNGKDEERFLRLLCYRLKR